MALVLFAILHVWAALKGAEGHAGEKSFLDLRVTNAENSDGAPIDCGAGNLGGDCSTCSSAPAGDACKFTNSDVGVCDSTNGSNRCIATHCTVANQDKNCASGVCELTTETTGTCQACFPNAEDACRAVLYANGYTPGCHDAEKGCDAEFAGYYAVKGCYAYKSNGDGMYSGHGFFGSGGSPIEMSENLTGPTVRITARECGVKCGNIALGEICDACAGNLNFACGTENGGMGRCDKFNMPSCSPPCKLFTEEACRAALNANDITPSPSGFSGNYLVKGCYYYINGYSGHGFFGSGGTIEKKWEQLTGPDTARILATECRGFYKPKDLK